MAGRSGSDESDIVDRLPVDKLDVQVDEAVCDWTLVQDSDSHQKRSYIIHLLINQVPPMKEHLRTVLDSGWDVNEILQIPHALSKKKVPRTALHEAARDGWTQGVKMLLEAGAKCKVPGVVENSLILALKTNWNCSPDLIKLLLQYGADPRDCGGEESTPLQMAVRCHESIHIVDELLKQGSDPNGQADRIDNIPLLYTIGDPVLNHKGAGIHMAKLLLEHGADANIRGTCFARDNICPLSAAVGKSFEVFSAFFIPLVECGADVNYVIDGQKTSCLLHTMMIKHGVNVFLQEQLDYYFLQGGNIHMEAGDHVTALHLAVRVSSRTNNIRWLIRHGADTSAIKVTHLTGGLSPDYMNSKHSDTPLFLLQTGMRVSQAAHTQLSNMETAIRTRLQDNTHKEENIRTAMDAIWYQLKMAEEAEPQRQQDNRTKLTFPVYLEQQVADLQDFSDESLQFYPEDIYIAHPNSFDILDVVKTMLQFLSQPQSLQWYCRRCVRENLVSLQPSVVKILPVPVRMKRYILCHEI